MSHKLMVRTAVVIAVVFLATIVVYPLIFGTDPTSKQEPPVELNLGH